MNPLADSPHSDVDLAVIGAGLAGTGLAASLRQRGYDGTILLLEAGRGPGGRAASRRRRVAVDGSRRRRGWIIRDRGRVSPPVRGEIDVGAAATRSHGNIHVAAAA